MRPFHHAKSSASRHGVPWEDHLPIHEFLDSTKFSCADLRHRIVLHSVDLGAALAVRAFSTRDPDVVTDIVRSHVREDMGDEMTLSQWMKFCNLMKLPKTKAGLSREDALTSLEDSAGRSAQKQKLTDTSQTKAVMDVLALPLRIAPEWKAYVLPILCNSAGLGIVKSVVGSSTKIDGISRKAAVHDPCLTAEIMIYDIYRGIPDLRRLVDAVDPKANSFDSQNIR